MVEVQEEVGAQARALKAAEDRQENLAGSGFRDQGSGFRDWGQGSRFRVVSAMLGVVSAHAAGPEIKHKKALLQPHAGASCP
jgi:hypothetical protein